MSTKRLSPVILVLLCIAIIASAQEEASDGADATEITKLKQEVARLAEEVKALKQASNGLQAPEEAATAVAEDGQAEEADEWASNTIAGVYVLISKSHDSIGRTFIKPTGPNTVEITWDIQDGERYSGVGMLSGDVLTATFISDEGEGGLYKYQVSRGGQFPGVLPKLVGTFILIGEDPPEEEYDETLIYFQDLYDPDADEPYKEGDIVVAQWSGDAPQGSETDSDDWWYYAEIVEVIAEETEEKYRVDYLFGESEEVLPLEKLRVYIPVVGDYIYSVLEDQAPEDDPAELKITRSTFNGSSLRASDVISLVDEDGDPYERPLKFIRLYLGEEEDAE